MISDIFKKYFSTSFLFFISIGGTMGQSSLLDKEITLYKTTASIAQLLELISEKGEFTFTYSNQIPVNGSVSLKNDSGTVRSYLDQLFPKGNVRYTPLKNRIALSIIKKAPLKPRIVVSGTIYDQERKEPLPFAHVSLLNNKRGAVSNINGEFRLLLPIDHTEDSLRITFVGYYPLKIKISHLTENTDIYLEEDKRVLEEVVFKALSTQQIIDEAIERIPDNYEQKPYITRGFYRLTAKRENAIAQLSEAVFDIYSNKGESEKPQFRLEKMRLIQDEKATEGLSSGQNPRSVVSYDVVDNIGAYDLVNKKGFKIHDFLFEETIMYNGKPTYVISFDQKDGTKTAGYEGRMYIDVETFAFVYFNFGLSSKGIPYAKYGSMAFRSLMTIFDIHIKLNQDRYRVTYKKIDDKYYMHTARFDTQLNLRSGGRHYNFNMDFHTDYVATDTRFENVMPFTKEETMGTHKIIEKQDSEFDPDFWNDYTILVPDTDFSVVAKTIVANNEAENLKVRIEDRLRKYPRDNAARIDSVLTYYNRKDLFNGNALIALEGKPIFQKSYSNSLVQNNSNTQFRIGSTAKTFTSILILMLENENKLSLKDTIGTYIPDYPHRNVTIEQLLTHQSGIPNYLQNSDDLLKVFEKELKVKEWVDTFGKDTLDFEPGTNFKYSNAGFLILAHLAEVVTGEDFSDLLKSKIFEPLRMNDTYSVTPDPGDTVPRGYYYGKLERPYPLENIKGAGGIVSTSEDLLKWSEALETDVLLPEEKLLEAFIPRAAYTDWDGDYGYGWMLDNYMFKAAKKHEIRYHPGTDFGYYSMFLKQPDEGITVILLSNTGDFPRFEITDLILNELN